MADNFANQNTGLASPLSGFAAATPDDSNDVATSGRGLYVGGTGDVKVTTVDGSVGTLPSLAAGIWHPMRVRRVWATGTTATSIMVGW